MEVLTLKYKKQLKEIQSNKPNMNLEILNLERKLQTKE